MLRDAGSTATLYTFDGGGHGHFDGPEVPRLTDDFLDRHLRGSQGTRFGPSSVFATFSPPKISVRTNRWRRRSTTSR
ncbi:hypothetical protein ACFQL4_20320 [Halosimplex aquaticum]